MSSLENYIRNAAVFLKYRTGKKYTKKPLDELIPQLNGAPGYVVLVHEKIAIIIVREDSQMIANSVNFGTQLERIMKSLVGAHQALDEIYGVEATRNSTTARHKIAPFLKHFNVICADKYPHAFCYFSFTYLFAFNLLKRVAFPKRRDFLKHLDPDEAAEMLDTHKMSEKEKGQYLPYYDVRSFPIIAENDPMCIWNGYRRGDVIYCEEMTATTTKIISIKTVGPPNEQFKRSAKTEAEEEAD